MWTANRDLGWEAPKRDFNAAALLQRRVDALAALDALAAVADELGPEGRGYLLGLIEARLASSKGLQTLAVADPLPVSA